MRIVPPIVVALFLATHAFADDAVSRLAGRWPFEIAVDAEFRKLAGEQLAKELDSLLEGGPKSRVVEGRWVVVEGCRTHACDLVAAFVVVDTRTGGVKAWTTTSGRTGVAAMEPPPEVVAHLDAWLKRLSTKKR